jgi:hypothetical protein
MHGVTRPVHILAVLHNFRQRDDFVVLSRSQLLYISCQSITSAEVKTNIVTDGCKYAAVYRIRLSSATTYVTVLCVVLSTQLAVTPDSALRHLLCYNPLGANKITLHVKWLGIRYRFCLIYYEIT